MPEEEEGEANNFDLRPCEGQSKLKMAVKIEDSTFCSPQLRPARGIHSVRQLYLSTFAQWRKSTLNIRTWCAKRHRRGCCR